LLAIGEGEAHTGEHVQARAEKLDLGSKDGQLTLLAFSQLVLGVGAASETNNTNNVTAANVLVLLLEAGTALLDVLGLADNLNLGADADGIGGGADV